MILYRYCKVLPANYKKADMYICNFNVKPGDVVIIKRKNNDDIEFEKAGLVLDVQEYTKNQCPSSPEYMKKIIRRFGENESATLQSEKNELEIEKKYRLRNSDNEKRTDEKNTLFRYAIGKENREKSLKELQEMLEYVPDIKKYNIDTDKQIKGGIKLSADGKTVTGYEPPTDNGINRIVIPSGVEKIDDNVFIRKDIDSLFLPKELVELGAFTLFNPRFSGESTFDKDRIKAKSIYSIEVESGNKKFCSDGIGLYRITEKGKFLVLLCNKKITTYTFPADVVGFDDYAFGGCSSLSTVVLSEGFKSFNEKSLIDCKNIKEIIISKSIKDIDFHSLQKHLQFRIHEHHESLFRDEDSIYEVLDDGTFKLIANLYHGKEDILILDNTSIIGSDAFYNHRITTEIKFPASVKRIERNAFNSCYISKPIEFPSTVEYVDAQAFYQCQSLNY